MQPNIAEQALSFMATVNLQLNEDCEHDDALCHRTHIIARFHCFSCFQVFRYKPLHKPEYLWGLGCGEWGVVEICGGVYIHYHVVLHSHIV